jgi:hypothetical protein
MLNGHLPYAVRGSGIRCPFAARKGGSSDASFGPFSEEWMYIPLVKCPSPLSVVYPLFDVYPFSTRTTQEGGLGWLIISIVCTVDFSTILGLCWVLKVRESIFEGDVWLEEVEESFVYSRDAPNLHSRQPEVENLEPLTDVVIDKGKDLDDPCMHV